MPSSTSSPRRKSIIMISERRITMTNAAALPELFWNVIILYSDSGDEWRRECPFSSVRTPPRIEVRVQKYAIKVFSRSKKRNLNLI